MKSEFLNEIWQLFERFGDNQYGEAINQREHALQCAELAREDGAADALIIAALLHDVGQFINDAGDAAERYGIDGLHEETGAAFLSRHLPATVVEPVRLHVIAKRYLCTKDVSYEQGLSSASLLSYRLQGGRLDENGMHRFESNPHFDDALRLRRYDDGGKRPSWAVPALETYRGMIESLICR